MVFSSLFFLFAFLPLNLLCYRAAPNMRWRNRVMLAFSLLFYAWAGPAYLLLLCGMTLGDWLLCRAMDSPGRSYLQRKLCLLGALSLDLGLLCIFKYLGFALGVVRQFTGWPEVLPEIALPIGISFYTFQLISYVVDVYRRDVVAQRSYWKLLLYVSLFHQCIAGPIVRYSTISDRIEWRYVTRQEWIEGASRFAIGLAKKAMLANPMGALADRFLCSTALAEGEAASLLASRSVLSLWMGAVCFTIQIYLDFSAYSDMAIGMGRMVGFSYLENFNYPYIADSITAFWRRWHISLSSFFRDYVYIPLGGNRCGRLAQLRNLTIVWMLTGLWHGASWNFVLWGLYYLLFLLAEKFVFSPVQRHIPRLLRHGYVLAVVTVGWVVFRITDFDCLKIALRGMAGRGGNPLSDLETVLLLQSNWVFLLLAVIACTPLLRNLYRRVDRAMDGLPPFQLLWTGLQCAYPILLLVLSTAALVGDQYNPFLYYRF